MFAIIAQSQPAQAEITVDTDFPGGSGVVLSIDQDAKLIQIRPDDHPGRGWRCWWYMKISGMSPGEPIRLEVGDAPWATPNRATYSTDGGQNWSHTEVGERDGKRIQYSILFDSEEGWVAWGPPFVPADAQALVDRLAASSAAVESFVLCKTREGRDTPALRFSAQSNRTNQRRPLVWIQARQHAWESGASWVCRGFAEWLASETPEAKNLREQAEVVIVPIMDIDNVYRGAGGKNQTPQDHNRDWSDMPHWRAVEAAQVRIAEAAQDGRLAAFIDLHNPSANDKQPYFYVPPRDMLTERGQENLDRFIKVAKDKITGPLRFTGKTIESGKTYDQRMWKYISKNWVAQLNTPAVAVTLETAWNTANSTTDGYMTVGRQLGLTLEEVIATEE